jgi:hypothetical protein
MIGTKQGDVAEYQEIEYFNKNKSSYLSYFQRLGYNDHTQLFLCRVTGKQYSSLSGKIVMTRADAYLVKVLDLNLLQKIVDINYLLDENILKTYSSTSYQYIERSGISIKMAYSKRYQLLKLTPNSFSTLFGDYELGAGISLYCNKESELYKNKDLLVGWKTTATKLSKYFSQNKQNYDSNQQLCLTVKQQANNKICSMIDHSTTLQQKIFNGIGLYKEPYTAYFLLQKRQLMPIISPNYSVTTGSGRSKGNYTVVLKPK